MADHLHSGISRRHLMVGAAGLTAAAAAGTTVVSGTAGATTPGRAKPMAKPIPGGVPSGVDSVGFIHWFLPGPPGSVTPVLGLEGMGLDVEPNTITDFRGQIAYAVIAGEATGIDGQSYACEFDVRAMNGEYVAEDGTRHRASFAFM